MKVLFSAIIVLLLVNSCSTTSQLKKYYTYEDKTVFDLIERLKKNPNDKEATDQLPLAYKAAADKRKEITTVYKEGEPGERWLNILKEAEVMQQMYNQVKSNPAASKALPNPWDPAAAMLRAKQNAAKEFYDLGLQYMNYDNRQSATTAYNYLSKANGVIPGYQNVSTLMREAQERATIKVQVNPVQYYQYNWSYWGFQSDWLQDQMVRDLNAQSFRDVRFYTGWQASAQRIYADRIVDLNFTELYVAPVRIDRNTVRRSAQIQTGTTKSIPAKPVYETVYATVTITRRIMQNRATLECRIFDQVSGNNILYDRFPDNYVWQVETATYRGDARALTPEDLRMINNSGNQNPPSRNEVADRLIRSCYSLLLNRIRNGVQFGM